VPVTQLWIAGLVYASYVLAQSISDVPDGLNIRQQLAPHFKRAADPQTGCCV